MGILFVFPVIADRYDRGDGKHSSIGRNYVVVEVLGMVDLLGDFVTGSPTGGIGGTTGFHTHYFFPFAMSGNRSSHVAHSML